MWIQFTFDVHRVYANSIRIQTKSSVKKPLEKINTKNETLLNIAINFYKHRKLDIAIYSSYHV